MTKIDNRFLDDEKLKKMEEELDDPTPTPDPQDTDNPNLDNEDDDLDGNPAPSPAPIDDEDGEGDKNNDPSPSPSPENNEESDDEDQPPAPSPKDDEDKDKPKAGEPDYKKKFVESTREALTSQSKQRKLMEAIDSASQVNDITDDELRTELNAKKINIDDLSDSEKALWKENILNKIKFNRIKEASEANKKIDEWAGKVDEFLETPEILTKFPKLAGKEDKFKYFAMKNTRIGADLEDLVRAFSFDLPAVNKDKKKGSLLLSNSNGKVNPSKPKKLTVDDVELIRKSDPKKYRELVKSGKIDEVDF